LWIDNIRLVSCGAGFRVLDDSSANPDHIDNERLSRIVLEASRSHGMLFDRGDDNHASAIYGAEVSSGAGINESSWFGNVFLAPAVSAPNTGLRSLTERHPCSPG
jgi:hypothetical protein